MAETKEEVVLLLLHDWLQLCSYGGRPRVKIDFLFWPISTDFDRSITLLRLYAIRLSEKDFLVEIDGG
jgi:hypothetical protein